MLGAGWLVVTALAVLVAWRGVDVVANSLTESRDGELSQGAVTNALDESDPTSTRGTASRRSTTTRRTGTTTADGQPSGNAREPAGPTGTPGTSAAPGTVTTSPSAPASPGTAGPGTSPPATSAPTTTAPPPTTAAPAQTRSSELQGGTVGVRFENGGARLLYATPKSGYTVRIDKNGPPEVDVRFDSDTHKSRLRAWWDGGPQARAQEEAET